MCQLDWVSFFVSNFDIKTFFLFEHIHIHFEHTYTNQEKGTVPHKATSSFLLLMIGLRLSLTIFKRKKLLIKSDMCWNYCKHVSRHGMLASVLMFTRALSTQREILCTVPLIFKPLIIELSLMKGIHSQCKQVLSFHTEISPNQWTLHLETGPPRPIKCF